MVITFSLSVVNFHYFYTMCDCFDTVHSFIFFFQFLLTVLYRLVSTAFAKGLQNNEITILNNRRFRKYFYSLCDRARFERKSRKDLQDRRPAMDPNTFINAVFACVSCECFLHGCRNNSECCGYDQSMHEVVTTSKETLLFYDSCFTCFDLAVVAITHTVLILSTILLSMEIRHGVIEGTRVYISVFLGGFSTFALLTLNIERFLALTYPFSHQTAVTKRRLVLFQAFLKTTTVRLSPLVYFYRKTCQVISL